MHLIEKILHVLKNVFACSGLSWFRLKRFLILRGWPSGFGGGGGWKVEEWLACLILSCWWTLSKKYLLHFSQVFSYIYSIFSSVQTGIQFIFLSWSIAQFLVFFIHATQRQIRLYLVWLLLLNFNVICCCCCYCYSVVVVVDPFHLSIITKHLFETVK